MTDDAVRAIVLVLAVIMLAPLVMMAVFMPFGMMGGIGFGGMWDWHGGTAPVAGMAVMWLVTLLILGAVGYFLYSWLADEGTSERDEALEELRLAYARGDLTEDEFEKRRDALEEDLERIESE
jgi:putative membrane protein